MNPNDLTEAIAMALDEPNLLSLRLANKEVADRTVKAFAANYLTNMTWQFGYMNGVFGINGAEILELRPEFALHVKDLCLRCRPNLMYPTAMFGTVDEQFSRLQNLRTLRLHRLYEYDLKNPMRRKYDPLASTLSL